MREPRTFDGVLNFRDVGGLPAGPGRRVRHGTLYRSDAFIDASPDDVAHVCEQLGVRRVIDLRAERELGDDWKVPFAQTGAVSIHRPIDRGPGNAIEGAREGERLAHRYLEYLVDSAAVIASTLRDFVDEQPPTMVNCRIGKDRTGVVIAVILGVVGVPAESIAEDYSRTAAAMPALLERLAQSETYRSNVSKLPAEMYSAERGTMLRFLSLVEEQFGGFPAWARNQGLTDSELDLIREHLTEPVD